MSRDMIIYWSLIVIMSTCMGLLVLFPWDGLMEGTDLPASKYVIAAVNFIIGIVFYGGMGYISHKIWKSMGLPGIYNHNISKKDQILTPLIIGIICGILLILGDMFFSTLHTMGSLPHPSFPSSLLASIQAGIGEEIIFRYLFISVWLWILWKKLFKENHFKKIYWIIAIVSAILFSAAHLPAVSILYNISLRELPIIFIVEIFVLNSIVSIAAAYYLKKYGILAAFGIHIWTDIVWHVIWGLTK